MAENNSEHDQQPTWLTEEIKADKQRRLEEEMRLPPESGNPQWLKKMAAEVDGKQPTKKPSSSPTILPK